MIRFEGVTRLFGAVKAVDQLDLAIPEKELCMLVGPSGSGKSTMLRMINRLIEPTEGSVSVDGRDVRAMRPELLRRSIGYVIQNVGLFPHLTVAANVATVPELLGWDRPRIEARVEAMLALVGMDPAQYRGRYPHELSGGEAQRIGVARALASDPPVILMDEPFSAVDPVNRQRLQDEFLSIQKELRKTIVFVTHDVDEAIRMADRIAVVRAGRLVQYDTPERILEHPADPFVAAFVGADRALKRLSRFPVRDHLRPAVSARIEEVPPLLKGLREGAARFIWIVDAAGTLIGSLDMSLAARCGEAADCVSSASIREMAVRGDASLKEALSRMLGTSARTVPVVDAEFRLLGELSLSDVERVSEGQTGAAAGAAGGTLVKRTGALGAWIAFGLLTVVFLLLASSTGLWNWGLRAVFPDLKDVLYPRADPAWLVGEHLLLVGVSSVMAVIVGVGTGVLVTRPRGRQFLPVAERLAAVVQTFPPAAVLALSVPALGFGFKPTIAALFLYSVLPIVRNTLGGLASVSADATDAARGMGMTPAQVLLKVELPLALPVILAGVRTSVIVNVGTATIGATIGAGGLGAPIISGLVNQNPAFLAEGTIIVGLLALTIDTAFAAIDGSLPRGARGPDTRGDSV